MQAIKNENVKIIAITGRSGSGKSMASSFLREKQKTVVDADKIAAEILENSTVIKKLVAVFGNDILNNDNTINKKVLAQKAFTTQQNRQKLVEITHPSIIDEIITRVNEGYSKGEKYVYVDGAVIIDEPFEKYCDKIIVITANYQAQLQRITKRDGISEQQAINRLDKQISQQRLQQVADFIIENNDIHLLQQDILKIDEVLSGQFNK